MLGDLDAAYQAGIWNAPKIDCLRTQPRPRADSITLRVTDGAKGVDFQSLH